MSGYGQYRHARTLGSRSVIGPAVRYVKPRGSLITHSVRREMDEWACSCGARWAVQDGEDHP